VKRADKEEGGATGPELVADHVKHDVPDGLVEAFHLQNRFSTTSLEVKAARAAV
jgi:hypothetical protein